MSLEALKRCGAHLKELWVINRLPRTSKPKLATVQLRESKQLEETAKTFKDWLMNYEERYLRIDESWDLRTISSIAMTLTMNSGFAFCFFYYIMAAFDWQWKYSRSYAHWLSPLNIERNPNAVNMQAEEAAIAQVPSRRQGFEENHHQKASVSFESPWAQLEDLASLSRLLPSVLNLDAANFRLLLAAFFVFASGESDGSIENVVNANSFLGTAFHVHGVHLDCHGTALLWSDRSETLATEKLDACFLMAEVGLETAEDNWRGWAEMKYFGEPL
jgi:hypothetical protein